MVSEILSLNPGFGFLCRSKLIKYDEICKDHTKKLKKDKNRLFIADQCDQCDFMKNMTMHGPQKYAK